MSLATWVERTQGRLPEPVGNARTNWRLREAVYFHVLDAASGCEGCGEAAPLPEYSPDDIELTARTLHRVSTRGLSDLRAPSRLEVRSPAAAFAVESALCEVQARREGRSLASLLAARAELEVQEAVQTTALVLARDAETATAEARARVAEGFAHLKLKIGRPGAWAQELEVLRAVMAAVPRTVTVRVDANGTLPAAELAARLDALAEAGVALVEEPAPFEALEALPESPVPLALDESLRGPGGQERARRLVGDGKVTCLVVKPMVLGGVFATLRWAALARSLGASVSLSHLFDGGVAHRVYAALALAVGGPGPHGLAPHPGLFALPGEGGWPIVQGELRAADVRAPAPVVEAPKIDRLDVRSAARSAPRQVALVSEGSSVTYAELAGRVQARVVALREAGVGPGRALMMVARVDASSVHDVLAAMVLRAPMIMLHPRLTAAERAAREAEVRPDFVLEGGVVRAGPEGPRPKLHPDALAVFFTSGTTGTPKGAVLTRAGFLAAADASARNLGWRDDDRWLLSIPLAHVGGFSILVRALAARRAVVLGDASPAGFWRAVDEDRATLASLVPTQLVRLLREASARRAPDHLRAVLLGGAAAPPELVARARGRGFGVLTTYGLTEACAQVATESPDALAPAGSVGRALPPGEVRVVDGRVAVRGPALMVGYLGRDGEGLSADGWFETGDLGEIDDAGNLFVRGRRADLIVTGGENVYPEEVERALRACPEVQDALVVGLPDPEWGARVAALVAPTSSKALDVAAIEAALRARLAAFKCPRRWRVVDAVPVNAMGKPDRRAAAALFDQAVEDAG